MKKALTAMGLLVVLVFFFTNWKLSSEFIDFHPVHLKSRHFTPTFSTTPDGIRPQRKESRRFHLLVQLNDIPSRERKKQFSSKGLKLLSYIPQNTWIAAYSGANPTTILAFPGVIWAGELTPEDKLDPVFHKDTNHLSFTAAENIITIQVVFHKDEKLPACCELVRAFSGRILGEVTGLNMVVVETPKKNVPSLARVDAVQWIEPVALPLREASDGIRIQIHVDEIQEAPYSLDGTGVDVLVYDSGQAGDHFDFGTRLIHGDTDSESEHSTMVAGIIGGDGGLSSIRGGSIKQWRGMAPNVDLISYGSEYSSSGVIFYENVPDIEYDFAQAQNWYGADVANISLNSHIYSNYPSQCDLMGHYGGSAILLDQIVRGGNSVVGIGDKYITIGTVGAERGWGSSCGTYGTISPPAAAKNPIHVGGANTNNTTMYAHSSWGPTADGRIKPTVVAGACQTTGDFGITTTDNNPENTYSATCGTSISSAAVTGGVALMLEHYRNVYDTNGNFWPSTAKSILIQTAVDCGNPGPDYQWGFGLVDIQAAVDLISQKRFLQASIDHGEEHVYYFRVSNGTGPVTVSLAWDDHEATFNADPTLINNLDLELVAPDGTIWQPWILRPTLPGLNAIRGFDDVNNQEQVQVFATDENLVGWWCLKVNGVNVPEGPQNYTLACDEPFSDKRPANPAIPLLLLSDKRHHRLQTALLPAS